MNGKLIAKGGDAGGAVGNLLVVIQFVALCQIGFGMLGARYAYMSRASYILRPIRDQEVRMRILDWHQETVRLSQYWCVSSGVVLFGLAGGARWYLRRERRVAVGPNGVEDRPGK